MAKFCIMSALRSEVILGERMVSQCLSKAVFVFSADNLKNTSINSCGLIFRCKNFSIDEKNSVGSWKDAFECLTESNDLIIITIKPDYCSPSVPFPFEWENFGAD